MNQDQYNKLVVVTSDDVNNIDAIPGEFEEPCDPQPDSDDELDADQYEPYVDIFNIYNVYYKTLFKKTHNSTLFDDIDDDTSTNRQLENFHDAIFKYKSAPSARYIELYDPAEYRIKYLQDNPVLPEHYPFYLCRIQSTEKVSHNLLTILIYIASFDWHNTEWSINQLADF